MYERNEYSSLSYQNITQWLKLLYAEADQNIDQAIFHRAVKVIPPGFQHEGVHSVIAHQLVKPRSLVTQLLQSPIISDAPQTWQALRSTVVQSVLDHYQRGEAVDKCLWRFLILQGTSRWADAIRPFPFEFPLVHALTQANVMQSQPKGLYQLNPIVRAAFIPAAMRLFEKQHPTITVQLDELFSLIFP